MVKKILIVFIVIIIVMCFSLHVMAFSQDDLNAMKNISNPSNYGTFTAKASFVLGIAQAVGIITAIVCLIMMGIKLVGGSLEDKAEVKKALIPYVIGTVLLFGAVGIMQGVKSMVDTSQNPSSSSRQRRKYYVISRCI